jgi:hypothetical protein
MWDKLFSFFNRPKKMLAMPDRPPTEAEWEEAKHALELSARPASFGSLGGLRPADINDRFTSWWGGNFLAHPNEGVPKCEVSGRDMLPILQIRMDELPFVPEVLKPFALLTLWFDVETDLIWETESGKGFVIRTYETLDGLVPIGSGYREHPTFPTFPINWRELKQDLPCWEEAGEFIPLSILRSRDSDWYFDHPAFVERAQLQSDAPIKIGGYSQWWQSLQGVDGGDYAFFLDTTSKGQFGFPAGGNANFFKTANNWEMRVDCT